MARPKNLVHIIPTNMTSQEHTFLLKDRFLTGCPISVRIRKLIADYKKENYPNWDENCNEIIP